ncbi:phosphoglycerate kinase [Coxiella endosymbiont of Ornithodoros amblus]|uniref:phosphoglycerate kinase n=1 Tax=Coxiella endosymbiont of Ornithodoros amblus TaxID=1656166 RepID=UPI00244E00A6|nr:phosphoglycerate kinase [Coxiella endosymbiont of Ornithodoros amblus]MBW5803029.1 phosphoglycerate kinase [Coxiella endosymbiont of Ornithodoros amblus]
MSENKMKALPFLSMSNLNLHNKRVMIRQDLNAPMKNGKIMNDERILRALPTIQKAIEQKARVIILSHLGRPKEGKFEKEFSLAPIARFLSEKLNRKVPLINDWLEGVAVKPGQVILCENVRFNKGENENNTGLAKRMAELCDIFVMDAFATAHRAQASTVGVSEYAKLACAGPLLISEIEILSRALENPQNPLVAVVGGSKVSTKIHLLENLLDKVDQLIVGGAIANTFLKAQGYPIGKSLCENEWLGAIYQFWEKVAEKNVYLPLPLDVIVADELSENAKATVKNIDALTSDESIFDVGPNTSATYVKLMAQAGTIVWNGPIGVFEIEAFSQGTRALGQSIAKSSAYSIVGGGDTLAALDKFNLTDQMSYVSTAGGAFLEFLEGKILPAIKILTQRAKEYEQK